jgi:chromosome segregation ATPase
VTESAAVEQERLTKAVGLLQHIFDSSTQDIKEFEEQSHSNNRGIQQLSSSITIAKEDIRDFTDQLQRIQPKLREYEQLRERHQQSEELVVRLGDEFENLRKQVETESLTASIRREIEAGNRTIADLNRTIDQILNKTSLLQEKVVETRSRISDLESKITKTRKEMAELGRSKPGLIAEKERLKRDLARCRAAHETVGGENELLAKEVREGIAYGKAPWQIRKELLSLKGEVSQLGEIEANQNQFEAVLASTTVVVPPLPPKKRLRLIPSQD